MCCSAFTRADFLEEGGFNRTSGIASLLLWTAVATAREGPRGAKATPCGLSAPESPGHGAQTFTLGAEWGLPVPGERRRSCRIKLFSFGYPPWELRPLVTWAQPFHTELQVPCVQATH